jgi:glycosyltransferase involved in cell wall biosynthesis
VAEPSLTPHILIYSDDPDLGGVAQFDHALALALARASYRVSVVKPVAQSPLRAEKTFAGINCLELGFDSTQAFARTMEDEGAPTQIFGALRPDLIVFSDSCPVSNLAAKRVAIRMKIPFLIVIGFVAPYLARNFAAYLPELANAFTAAKTVIAVSRENLDLLRGLFGLDSDRGEIIHYGRPESFFAPVDAGSRLERRRELGLAADDVLCVTAARLDHVKGFDLQLQAIAHLRNGPARPHLRFAWLGTGPLADALKYKAVELGVGDRIDFLGQRWDVPAWLDAADIFLLPSRAEGMPLCLMEAMAKGVPVAASAVSGIPEELGNTGRLLPDPALGGDAIVEAIVATLQLWSGDAFLRRAVGAAGRERARQMFREETMLRRYLRVVNRILLPQGDYVAPGLSLVRPDAAFPNMVVGDQRHCDWPYLRRDVPHNWYVDRRLPGVGFVNRDEASILYNTALRFRGRDALEIGCHLGWSACHLALGGVWLDVVDPFLEQQGIRLTVEESLTAAGVRRQVNLVPARSPDAVVELHRRRGRGWNLIFIDGNHEADGPRGDAIVIERFAAPDALVLFHDLAAPAVARGLDYFRERGWRIGLYQTAQIMGVAWRGAVEPVAHEPDPAVQWTGPAHLEALREHCVQI